MTEHTSQLLTDLFILEGKQTLSMQPTPAEVIIINQKELRTSFPVKLKIVRTRSNI